MQTLLNPAKKYPIFDDIVLLLARTALGVILIAHGWQKFNEWTLAGTASSFGDMGVPVPGVTSVIAASAELIGGVMVLIGLLTPLVAVLNVLVLLSAFFLVHVESGVFVDNGGYELVLGLAAGLLLIAARGAGKFSIDALLPGSPYRKREVNQPADEQFVSAR
ncbi:DoxX family protein [Yaniella sp.]|uniref:DoxX family protein n=1 Tax=Yaniella sp. TaxID=2773929 RepID=UPI0026491527|nr:DoxX family protein [Yaniella sp.]MDN6358634.1 DoxX family protein [Yaniella sp.]